MRTTIANVGALKIASPTGMEKSVGVILGNVRKINLKKARKECAIRGAKKSIKKGLASMQKKFTKEQMKMWNSCYPNEKVANDYAEKAYIEMKKNPANPFAK